MRHPARTLFACWLVVVATGTVVTHRHAAARGHTHGLGWVSLPAAPDPAGLPAGHRHFVLLGVEFGATPCGQDDGNPDGPRVGPVADAPAASGEAAPEVPAGPDAAPPEARSPALPAPARAAGLTRTPTSCPLTSFSRSGVLRA
jgi:hypothetical protein